MNIKGKKIRKFRNTFTVVSFEPLGFSMKNHKMVQIGALKVVNDKVVSNYESLVACDNVPLEITERTGITVDMLKSAPSVDVVLKDFLAFIGDDVIVADNADYVMWFITGIIKETLDIDILNDYYDTFKLKEMVGYISKYGFDWTSRPLINVISSCEDTLELYLKAKTTKL